MSLENKGAVRLIDVDGDPVKVSSTGNLMVDIGAASISGDLSVNLTTADKVSVFGNTTAAGDGDAKALRTDADGHLQVDVLSGTAVAVTHDALLELGTAINANDQVDVNIAAGGFDGAVTGTVGHNITTIASDEMDVTTAGTALVLSVSQACKKVDIQAKITNTGKIYIGGSTVDSDEGLELRRGDIYSLEIGDLNNVYVDSSVDGEGVRYTWYG